MEARPVRSGVAIGGLELRRGAIWTASALALCLAMAPASAGAAVSAADRAATHTFLQATYNLDLELRADAGKASAADSRAAAAIAAECPKVLAGAPGGPSSSLLAEGKQLSPRARGEAARHEHQYTELMSELESSLNAPAFQVYAPALARFTAAVTPLRWSNPAIAVQLKFELELVQVVFDPAGATDVCADLHAWVASGYETLPAGTRAVQSNEESLIKNAPLAGGKSAEALVKPYEGPAERAIVRLTEALRPLDVLDTDSAETRKLHRALGIEEAEDTETSVTSVPFAHGRTHTGQSYRVEASKGYGPRCGHIISFSLTTKTEFSEDSSSSESTLRCVTGAKPAAHPQVSCDNGVIQVESNTLAATRRVRLVLSDGRTILSPVTPVPVKYGGPAGVYFQTLRGPAPYPVSLSELDGQGRVLRTVKLQALKRCRRQAASSFSVDRQIVTGMTPGGGSYYVSGFSTAAGRQGTFHLEAGGPAFPNAGTDVVETRTVSSSPREGRPDAEAKPFSLQLAVGCEPHPFALVYGQLQPPGTRVLVATATSPLAPLTQVAFPRALKATGTLAYGLLEGLPSELVVQSATGATLLREDLAARARTETEFCEGYVEPGA